MQLSVEVKRQRGVCIFSCRGSLLQGEASDYLLHLMTRSNRNDVILDLAALAAFDRAGLETVLLGSNFLTACHHRLFLRHAPSDLLEYIRSSHNAFFFDLYPLPKAKFADAANG